MMVGTVFGITQGRRDSTNRAPEPEIAFHG